MKKSGKAAAKPRGQRLRSSSRPVRSHNLSTLTQPTYAWEVCAIKRVPQGGFTLVEIAIVLVLVGLLLGGILKGQEMIVQARIKDVINDFNGMTAAVNTYQDRYRALAGDDRNAGDRWVGRTNSGTGDGQWTCSGGAAGGYKTTLTAPPTNADECNLFWQHLRLAGFIRGQAAGTQGGQQPSNAVLGITGVQTGGMGFTSNIVCTTNLPDRIAIAVDTHMDDAKATTGRMRGIKQTASNPDLRTPVNPGDNYVEDGVSQWTICKNM
jgi:prepilin-type N-terminal cleavage/methylation domain-containing protein